MIIGVDFDNTIVCYDALFHRVARERELVPPSVAANKNAVRDHLRSVGLEHEWTALQGYVYGPRMVEADPFPGVHAFFRACRHANISVFIISHKTRHPYLGEPYDLHAAAQNWLDRQGFFSASGCDLDAHRVFFETTKAAKLARISTCACTHFIDDLPEILTDKGFPSDVERLLFSPGELPAGGTDLRSYSNWKALEDTLTHRQAKPNATRPAPPLTLADITPFAARFGAAPPLSLHPISGGANNRVFKARTVNEENFIIKQYFSAEGDSRDRFHSEQAFYNYSWNIARADCIPQPLAWDKDARLGAFSFVSGQRVEKASEKDVEQALAFFATINALPCSSHNLPLAAEACFTLGEHLLTVRRRIQGLDSIVTSEVVDKEAHAFVRNELAPAFERLLQAPDWIEAIATESSPRHQGLPRCISPSDFGLHNCLRRNDGRLVFFDFEYAGWDDPAKLVCDFFCQPAVPIPLPAWDGFISRVAESLHYPSPYDLAARCRLLLPLYQLKWCTIMLNEFLPSGSHRRGFSVNDEPISRKTRQLAKAVAALHHIRSSN